MNRIKELEISAGIAIASALLITPVLVKMHFLHSFLAFSVVSQAENLFLFTLLSMYVLSRVLLNWRHQHKLQITAAGLAFYLVALQGFLVIGLASLALLWVIPLCWYQFAERKLASAI